MLRSAQVAACCAFALTALYRFLATASFPNDEHEYLAVFAIYVETSEGVFAFLRGPYLFNVSFCTRQLVISPT